MLTSIPVSTAILVVSIVLFVVMCYKGVHTATAALIASAIMAFGTTDGWMTTMTTTWVTGWYVCQPVCAGFYVSRYFLLSDA